MARWIFCFLLGISLIIASMGATRSEAQERPTPPVTANAVADGVSFTPFAPPVPQYPTLLLTFEDKGGTFTIPVNSRIVLRIPRLPRSRLVYDPSILQALMTDPSDDVYRPMLPPLIAIRPGRTILAVGLEPCHTIPCPEMPSFQFRVTIVVMDNLPPPPLPPSPIVPLNVPQTYIGTAYLNQTVRVQVGQVVVLDLPSLDMRGPVQVQYDPAMLRPFPGQTLTYPQPGGWHFQVTQPGTSVLTVQGNGCTAGGTGCPPTIWFQVTLTSTP